MGEHQADCLLGPIPSAQGMTPNESPAVLCLMTQDVRIRISEAKVRCEE